MSSSSDVEFVEDSEPERLASQLSRSLPESSPDPPSPTPHSPSFPPPTSLPSRPAASPEQPAPAPTASTSRYFQSTRTTNPPPSDDKDTPLPPSARPRRALPWDNLQRAPLSRKVSLPPSCPSASTTAPPPSPTLASTSYAVDQPFPPKKARKSRELSDARRDEEGGTDATSASDRPENFGGGRITKVKKEKKKHKVKTASSLLRSTPALPPDAPAPEDTKGKRSAAKKRTSREAKGDVDVLVLTDTSIEGTAAVKVEDADWDQPDELDEMPRRLDLQAFRRIELGLPPLPPKKDSPKEAEEDELESSGGEGDDDSDGGGAARKLHGGLNQFKYKVAGYTGGSVSLPGSSTVASSSRPSVSTSKLSATALPATPPIELPSIDLIRLLQSCPVCESAWTTSKMATTKETHLRNCAQLNDYSAETILVLAERQVLALAHDVDMVRREGQMRRSLFERTIGKGEGTGTHEVKVVGVEKPGDGPTDQYRPERLEEVQSELDGAKRKPPVVKLGKIAQEIKDRRRAEEEAQVVADAKARRRKLDPDAMDEDDQVAEVAPRPTGMLAVESAESRAGLVVKANALLARLGGTGLTQAVVPAAPAPTASSLALPSTTNPPDGLRPSIVLDDDDEDAPPSTQPFEPSRLARKFTESGKVQVVALPMKERQSSAPRHESPALDDLPSSPDRSASSSPKSLWRAAGCTDDATSRRVVIERTFPPTKHRQPTSGSDSPGFVFPDDDSDDSTTPPPRPSTSAAPPPPPPGMPDYASWNLAVLQSQVSQYGYRISKERSVLVAQLTKVWCAINLPAGVAKPARKPRAKPAKKKKVLVSDAEDGDGEDEEGEQETVGERLRKLILADDELYMKVLRYEPIFFDEIVALAAANGIKAAKPLLMRCLDEQCVTFFTQDPASGTRKRYR